MVVPFQRISPEWEHEKEERAGGKDAAAPRSGRSGVGPRVVFFKPLNYYFSFLRLSVTNLLFCPPRSPAGALTGWGRKGMHEERSTAPTGEERRGQAQARRPAGAAAPRGQGARSGPGVTRGLCAEFGRVTRAAQLRRRSAGSSRPAFPLARGRRGSPAEGSPPPASGHRPEAAGRAASAGGQGLAGARAGTHRPGPAAGVRARVPRTASGGTRWSGGR
ncbi:zinc finger C4H2 domain-containing protein isoform X2 [Strix aluco]|uniref:zinc finger C4H2 domain-containing protein isoform X2 n=1 Tax=Strix aluco TaxID=111821 RepID=UPI003DA4C063